MIKTNNYIQPNYIQPSQNQTKKEWTDEYKKLSNNYKQDEKNLIHSYFTEDYHMNKIFLSLKQEDELEKKLINDTLKNMKLSVNEIDSIFKGTYKSHCHNNELRQKIQKMEDLINKNRVDLSNKFQNLLDEEDQLQSEINDFENKFQYELNLGQQNNDMKYNESVEMNYNNKRSDKNNNFEFEENKYNFNVKDELNFKRNLTFDSYLHFILNDQNKADILITEDDIFNIAEKYMQLNEIKDKTNIIDSLIDKKFQGQNLGWKAKDHQEFLKIRAANNNKINTLEFLMDLENALPFIQKNELKAHIKSFNQYLKLTDFKRVFLNRYKTIKKDNDDIEKRNIMEKLELEKVTEKEKKKNEILLNCDEEEKRKKIEEWKLEKQKREQKEREEKYKREQLEKKKEKEKFIGIIQNNKQVVEEFKKKKEETVKENQLKSSKTLSYKTDINEIDLERVKERNIMLEEKKKMLVKSKSINNVKKTENYVKYKLKNMEKFADIEPKFDKPSENEERKKRKKHDYTTNKDANTMAGAVLRQVGRAIPAWRQGL